MNPFLLVSRSAEYESRLRALLGDRLAVVTGRVPHVRRGAVVESCRRYSPESRSSARCLNYEETRGLVEELTDRHPGHRAHRGARAAFRPRGLGRRVRTPRGAQSTRAPTRRPRTARPPLGLACRERSGRGAGLRGTRRRRPVEDSDEVLAALVSAISEDDDVARRSRRSTRTTIEPTEQDVRSISSRRHRRRPMGVPAARVGRTERGDRGRRAQGRTRQDDHRDQLGHRTRRGRAELSRAGRRRPAVR